jgi:hypothetical protein
MEPLAYLYLTQDNEAPDVRQFNTPFCLSVSHPFAPVHCSSKAAVRLVGVLSSFLAFTSSNAALASEFTKVLLTDEYGKSYAGGGYFYILQEFIEDKLALAVPNPPQPPVPIASPVSSPSVSAPSHCTILKHGDSGPAVQCLQDLLRQAGYFDGPSTGYFGPATKEAVKAFQYDCGLLVDGIAGPQTLAALHKAIGQSAPTPTPTLY